MDCQIIERTELTTTLQISNEQLKPFWWILLNSTNYYASKFDLNNGRMHKNKVVPFLLNHFQIFLERNNQLKELQYLQEMKNQREHKQFVMEDLIQMFKHKKEKSIQLLWLEYLQTNAALDVCEKIHSKKFYMYYLRAIDEFQYNTIELHPYKYLYLQNGMNQEYDNYTQSLNDDDKCFIGGKKLQNLEDFLEQITSRRQKKIKLQP